MAVERKQRFSWQVVSTDCSMIRSLRHSFRRHAPTPQSPPPPPIKHSSAPKRPLQTPVSLSHSITSPATYSNLAHIRNGRAAAEAYWQRTGQLEAELNQLEKWLLAEQRLSDCLNKNNSSSLFSPCVSHSSSLDSKRNSDNSIIDLAELEFQRARQGLATTELVRLAGGGYLHSIKKIGRPWGRLVVQVSDPAIVPDEAGPTIMQVLRSMVSMGVKDLSNSLLETMPMVDISGKRPDEIEGSPVLPGLKSGFMEEIVLSAVGKMEGPVMAGLKIQLNTAEKAGKVVLDNREARRCENCITLVMLIQLRDPMEDYEAVGELMIGLIEASAEVSNVFRIKRIHVAGMKSVRKRENSCSCENHSCLDAGRFLGSNVRSSRRDILWSISLNGCTGKQNRSSKQYFRNQDIVFHRKMNKK